MKVGWEWIRWSWYKNWREREPEFSSSFRFRLEKSTSTAVYNILLNMGWSLVLIVILARSIRNRFKLQIWFLQIFILHNSVEKGSQQKLSSFNFLQTVKDRFPWCDSLIILRCLTICIGISTIVMLVCAVKSAGLKNPLVDNFENEIKKTRLPWIKGIETLSQT